MTNVRNDGEVIIAIRDSLRTNLTDPRAQYEIAGRTWIHDDKPLTSATFPRVRVRKRPPSTSEVIDIGMEFMEWRAVILDIQLWTKTPFKWKDSSNVYLQDETLVSEWLHKIWVEIKGDFSTLKTDHGLTGFKLLEEGEPYLEPDTQLYTGIVSIRCWYFTKAAS